MSLAISGLGSRLPYSPAHLPSRTDATSSKSASEDVANAARDTTKSGSSVARPDPRERAGANAVDLSTVFQSLSSSTLSSILQLQSNSAPSDGGSQAAADRFQDLDSDGNGTISRNEFVAGRPDNVSEENAGKLYDSIAGDNTDGLTADQLAQGMEKVGGPRGHQGPPPPPPSDASQVDDTDDTDSTSPGSQLADMLKKLDEDDDGTISRDEFVSGRSDDVSEEDAGKLYDRIASDNGDSTEGLTADQLAEGLERTRGPQGHRGAPPPPPSDDAEQAQDQQSEETTDTSAATVNQELVSKLLDTLKSVSDGYAEFSGQSFGISTRQYDVAA